MTRPLPTRSLPDRPDLNHLHRQAKQLLDNFRAGNRDEVDLHFRDADPATFALHDAQLVIARAYGFDSWPKLKSFVDGVTAERLVAAIRSGNITEVRDLLTVRPELARMSKDNLQVLHHAVLVRSAEMVRLLVEHGADPHAGVYPHRDATSPLTIARERGYDDIASILEKAPMRRANTPAEEFGDVEAGQAVVRGDADWLRARHAEGKLENSITHNGGLLTVAVVKDRPEILMLLLDLGFDPNERTRIGDEDDVAITAGMPLWHCAASGKMAMAELLLRHGADPNAMVYASGTPLHQAYGRGDNAMIALLERNGGTPDLTTAGLYRRTELARSLTGSAPPANADAFLWAAACGGDPEIVRLALSYVDWPRYDARWFQILEQPLRMWNHGPVHWSRPDWPRDTYVSCLRLLLERADPNVTGRTHFGLTVLHSLAGSRSHVGADDRLAFATALLDAGARLDTRDELLRSTPLGWACRWGRPELVRLYLQRGADASEAGAEPWARPLAWAQSRGHAEIEQLLSP